MMLAKFRHLYPQGSLVSELVEIDRGKYIVKAIIEINHVVLTTALAGADTVEAAEDRAKERAIASLNLETLTPSGSNSDSLTVVPQKPPSNIPSIAPKVNDETKIVNFSKPRSEVSQLHEATEQNSGKITREPEPAPTISEFPAQEPTRQAPPMVEHSEQITETAASPPSAPVSTPPANNLFGDTFNAEIPELASPTTPFAPAPAPAELEVMDFNEIKQKTDIEIKRLGWSKDQGKEFLMSHYGKRSRLHLTDEQLLEFLRYLEKLPNPVR